MVDNNLNPVSSNSQRWRILRYLQEGGELTSITMLEMFGAYDGRKRISELRRLGHPVKDRPGFNPETGKRFKIYYMEPGVST